MSRNGTIWSDINAYVEAKADVIESIFAASAANIGDTASVEEMKARPFPTEIG